MDSSTWRTRDAAVVWHGFTQMSCYSESSPVIVESAEGHELIDVDGRRYLDAISSLWVNTLGHHVPELDEAVREQLDRGAHSTMLGNGNRVVVELAEALAARVPVDRPHFLFASDGATAVEQALKIAFQYWTNQGVAGRTSYLAFGDAYHGDTIGSLSVGAGGIGTTIFDPLRFPVRRAPRFSDPACFPTAVDMIRDHHDELAAVIVEPLVQGAAGMQLAPPQAFTTLAEACRTHDVLLICDEVATGFGRTGSLFASEQCGIRPDLMCLGKGLTAGYLPQSVTVAAGRVFDAFLGPDLSEKTLHHGHSYSGNALSCAVALRHLELLDEWDVLANVQARSEELRELLTERITPIEAVCDVRLHGLMGGVELAPPAPDLRWGRRVCAAAVERGVLLRPLGDVVVLMPPLTITSLELHRIVEVLAESIEQVCVGAAERPRSLVSRAAESATVIWSSRDDSMTWHAWAEVEAAGIRAADRWRAPRAFDGAGVEGKLAPDDSPVVSFAANDYLGLSQHPEVIAAAHAALDRWGAGAGAARLTVGSRPVHHELEVALADWKHSERAVLFPTGFAANLGVLTTFGGPDTLVCSDELNHASIIDGCRLSRAEIAVYQHLDVEHADALLKTAAGRRSIVVTESVFSMDGDVAPVEALTDVCARHGALLVVDEAHAVLESSSTPIESAVERAAGDLSVLRVGTLSKTLGALGGFVAGDAALTELLVNRARSYIFTTASTPADSAAALAALEVLRSPEGTMLCERLRGHIETVRPGHPSPIVPVILGDESHVLAAAAQLLEAGMLVPAIRPPTVPPGTSRLRVTLSAAHTDTQVEALRRALAQL